MNCTPILFAMLAAAFLASVGVADDGQQPADKPRIPVERHLLKEPHYTQRPRYVLLAFGAERPASGLLKRDKATS